jgi:hypothetical protein
VSACELRLFPRARARRLVCFLFLATKRLAEKGGLRDGIPPTKELDVVLHGHAVQRVQHGVPRAVGRRRAPVRLPPPAVIKRLPPERPLVDFPILRATKGQSVVF